MISKRTVKRLVIYNRILKDLYESGEFGVTSGKIAQILSITPAIVRRDLSALGKKGTRGVGYDILELINVIDSILGLKSTWGVILVGAGNLGRALFHYPGFKKQGFEFRIVADGDPAKIGKTWGGIKIDPVKSVSKNKLIKQDIEIAVIAVPDISAQSIADMLIRAGIKEILNFAPVTLNIPEDVTVRYVDMALELANLSFNISNRKFNKKKTV